jgi:hypothetical protein
MDADSVGSASGDEETEHVLELEKLKEVCSCDVDA